MRAGLRRPGCPGVGPVRAPVPWRLRGLARLPRRGAEHEPVLLALHPVALHPTRTRFWAVSCQVLFVLWHGTAQNRVCAHPAMRFSRVPNRVPVRAPSPGDARRAARARLPVPVLGCSVSGFVRFVARHGPKPGREPQPRDLWRMMARTRSSTRSGSRMLRALSLNGVRPRAVRRVFTSVSHSRWSDDE